MLNHRRLALVLLAVLALLVGPAAPPLIHAQLANPDGLHNTGGSADDPGLTGTGSSGDTSTGTGDDTGASDPGSSEPTDGSDYTVVTGDTLWDLAARFYGDAGRWIEIFKANLGSIANPNLIFPGQVFVIPGVNDLPPVSTPPGTSDPGTAPADSKPPAPDAAGAIVMDVPHLYQGSNPRMPWSTCGPTSLAMVLNYFGKNVTADQLIEPCGCTEADGTCIGGLAAAAKQYGFPNASTGNFDLAWLDKQLAAGNPVIANVKFPLKNGGWGGHYMVVIGVDAAGNYICADPAKPEARTNFTRSYLWEVWNGHHNAAACVLK